MSHDDCFPCTLACMSTLCSRTCMVPKERDPGIYESQRVVKELQRLRSRTKAPVSRGTRAPISYHLQQVIWPHWTSVSVSTVALRPVWVRKRVPRGKSPPESSPFLWVSCEFHVSNIHGIVQANYSLLLKIPFSCSSLSRGDQTETASYLFTQGTESPERDLSTYIFNVR